MKKKTLIISFVAAALALALSACGAKPAGIALGDEPLEVTVGSTAVLEPEFSWEGEAPAEAPAVSYSSADEAVAAVDESGVVTGVAAGETTVTATVGEMSATREVVVNIATESLTVEELSLHLADGAVQAVVAVEPAELAEQLTFKTGDETIATVDENGNVTPAKEGHTSLLVLAPDGTRAKAMVTVWSGPKELTLTSEKTEVTKGGTVALAAVDETGTAAAPAGSQGGAAAQPSEPAQPEPAPQPQPDPAPQPENPSGGHVHDSPTVDLDPDAGNDLTDFWS